MLVFMSQEYHALPKGAAPQAGDIYIQRRDEDGGSPPDSNSIGHRAIYRLEQVFGDYCKHYWFYRKAPKAPMYIITVDGQQYRRLQPDEVIIAGDCFTGTDVPLQDRAVYNVALRRANLSIGKTAAQALERVFPSPGYHCAAWRPQPEAACVITFDNQRFRQLSSDEVVVAGDCISHTAQPLQNGQAYSAMEVFWRDLNVSVGKTVAQVIQTAFIQKDWTYAIWRPHVASSVPENGSTKPAARPKLWMIGESKYRLVGDDEPLKNSDICISNSGQKTLIVDAEKYEAAFRKNSLEKGGFAYYRMLEHAVWKTALHEVSGVPEPKPLTMYGPDMSGDDVCADAAPTSTVLQR